MEYLEERAVKLEKENKELKSEIIERRNKKNKKN